VEIKETHQDDRNTAVADVPGFTWMAEFSLPQVSLLGLQRLQRRYHLECRVKSAPTKKG